MTRRERRRDARDAAALADARAKLARLEAGGSAARPIDVASASIVEARALDLGCARCGGALRLDTHDAVHPPEGPRRLVRGRCRACLATREIWVRVVPPRPS